MKEIEKKLINYPVNKAKLNQITYEIELHGRNDLLEKKIYYENEVFSIENSLDALSEEDRKLVDYKYFKKLKWIEIENLMSLSKNTLNIRKNKILKKIDEIINL